MKLYRYRALDSSGEERRGKLRAGSGKEAEAALRSRGWMPRELTAVAPRRGRAEKAPRPGGGVGKGEGRRRSGGFPRPVRIRAAEITLFTRRLATLLRSGVPLLRSLEVTGTQERNRHLAGVIGGLAESVRAGNSLSDGLLQHAGVFDSLFLHMVRAGETGGGLEGALERIAAHREKAGKLRGRVRSALAYPVVVLGVATAVVSLLLVYVVPQFERIFADLLRGAELPALTRAVVGSGRFLQENVPVVLGALLALAVLGRVVLRSGPGRRRAEGILLRLPRIGGLVTKANLARFARTLGSLLASGVPILESLTLAREGITHHRLAEAIGRIHDRVRDGEAVAPPMGHERVFPPMVTSMVEVGEETGQLEAMLGRVADAYEEEVDNELAAITSLLEPVLIVFLAVLVGIIVIALFLPIVRIIETLSG